MCNQELLSKVLLQYALVEGLLPTYNIKIHMQTTLYNAPQRKEVLWV